VSKRKRLDHLTPFLKTPLQPFTLFKTKDRPKNNLYFHFLFNPESDTLARPKTKTKTSLHFQFQPKTKLNALLEILINNY